MQQLVDQVAGRASRVHLFADSFDPSAPAHS